MFYLVQPIAVLGVTEAAEPRVWGEAAAKPFQCRQPCPSPSSAGSPACPSSAGSPACALPVQAALIVPLLQWGARSPTVTHMPPWAFGDPQPATLILALTALLASGEDVCRADAGSRQPVAEPQQHKPLVRSAEGGAA